MIQCYNQYYNASERYSTVVTLQCKWKLQCGDQLYNASVQYKAVKTNAMRVKNDRVRRSALQCKWTVQGGDQHYSASERYSALINNTVQMNIELRWYTLQGKWTIYCCHQHCSECEKDIVRDQTYSACDARYIVVINNNMLVNDRVRRSTLQCNWMMQCED
jgi:hypothetical protein